MQGYSREAEGEAQPIQEADLIAQQVSCQQQSAHFLWAEKPEGDVSRSRPLCQGATPGHSHTNRGAPPRPPGHQAGLQGTEGAPQAPRTRLLRMPSSLRYNQRGLSQNSVPIENAKRIRPCPRLQRRATLPEAPTEAEPSAARGERSVMAGSQGTCRSRGSFYMVAASDTGRRFTLRTTAYASSCGWPPQDLWGVLHFCF